MTVRTDIRHRALAPLFPLPRIALSQWFEGNTKLYSLKYFKLNSRTAIRAM
jgi:hypothetical protein